MGKTVGKILRDKQNPPPSVKARLTGNSGFAFQDGTMRGAIAALVGLGIAFVATVVDIDPEQLAIIYAATGPALFVGFGWYDARRKRDG